MYFRSNIKIKWLIKMVKKKERKISLNQGHVDKIHSRDCFVLSI